MQEPVHWKETEISHVTVIEDTQEDAVKNVHQDTLEIHFHHADATQDQFQNVIHLELKEILATAAVNADVMLLDHDVINVRLDLII